MERPKPPDLDTRVVHGPHVGAAGAMSTPIVHSATFSFESLDDMRAAQAAGSAGAFYQRDGHPTIHAVEERLAALEGAEEALLFPSGMGAISATFRPLSMSRSSARSSASRSVNASSRARSPK